LIRLAEQTDGGSAIVDTLQQVFRHMKEFHWPPIVAQQLYERIFYHINQTTFNELMTSPDRCTTISGFQIRMAYSYIEHWLMTDCASGPGAAEVRGAAYVIKPASLPISLALPLGLTNVGVDCTQDTTTAAGSSWKCTGNAAIGNWAQDVAGVAQVRGVEPVANQTPITFVPTVASSTTARQPTHGRDHPIGSRWNLASTVLHAVHSVIATYLHASATHAHTHTSDRCTNIHTQRIT